MEHILGFMRDVISEFEQEDECLCNIEQAPAESAGYVYAQADIQRFGKEIEQFVPRYIDPETGKVEYFYVSQITPPYCAWSLKTQLYVEAIIQPLYSGGVTKLLYLTEPFFDESWSRREQEEGLERLAKFVREALSYEPAPGKRIIYFAPTPTVNRCLSCHYVWVGNPYRETDPSGLPVCPKCGSNKVESWSRPVGYYRPVRNWNPGRRAEFMLRLEAAKYLKP
jgi:ribonucleoside-triphosphate reductase